VEIGKPYVTCINIGEIEKTIDAAEGIDIGDSKS
jgi:hypothetical protein